MAPPAHTGAAGALLRRAGGGRLDARHRADAVDAHARPRLTERLEPADTLEPG
ncbi:hypothetical protein [Georgenia ruanii]|uniref:hypothetical protein n=1 Tax=Georgenia ruanii TaxID=348442 RepID=UPI00186B3F37|nr:hypothetical protein [Georgenia ruanii]